MPVRIRLARRGAKKRPFYQIVVADSRRAVNGKFIDQIGTYNPMLPKDHPDRIKINNEKAKEWIQKGAQPSDRVHLFLSNNGVLDKPIITEKTKKHLPKKKAQERLKSKQEPKKPVAKEETKEDSSSDKTEATNVSNDKTTQSKNVEEETKEDSSSDKKEATNVSNDKTTQSENKGISVETIEQQSVKEVETLTDNVEVSKNNSSNETKEVKKEKEGKSS